MTDHSAAYEAWTHLMMDDALLEDRREYDEPMLMKAYSLGDEDARLLRTIIHDRFENVVWMTVPATDLQNILMDAHEGNFEGWSDSDKFVIEAFLADMGLALRSI